MGQPIEIQVLRGDHVESVHQVVAAVVDAEGKVLHSWGDAEFPTFLRSCAKPFQAIPFIESGAFASFGSATPELALACSSHLGKDIHVAAAKAMLKKADVPITALQNHEHSESDLEDFRCGHTLDDELQALGQNCSGKHSAMVVTQKFWGESLQAYRQPESRYQQTFFEAFSGLVGVSVSEMQKSLAPDGCGTPVFQLPLSKLALAYAKLGAGQTASLQTIFSAMTQHPEYVRGPDDFNTALIKAGRGEWVAKLGYEGVYGIGHKTGVGLAVKVLDGSLRALAPAILKVFEELGWLTDQVRTDLHAWFARPITNNHGVTVGKVLCR